MIKAFEETTEAKEKCNGDDIIELTKELELDLELDDFTENESIEDEDELADDDSMNDAEELDDLNDSLFRELNKESNEFILNSF